MFEAKYTYFDYEDVEDAMNEYPTSHAWHTFDRCVETALSGEDASELVNQLTKLTGCEHDLVSEYVRRACAIECGELDPVE